MPENGSESKNLILLLDGTWNDPDYGAADTNIVRLRELISQVMHKQTSAPASPAAGVQAGDVQGRRNVVFYQRCRYGRVGQNPGRRLRRRPQSECSERLSLHLRQLRPE